MADLRGEVAALSIGAAETVVERNLDRQTQTAARRELHQPGGREPREGIDDGRRPHRGVRRGPARGRPGRGHPRRGRGRAVPLRPTLSRAPTSCGWRSPTRHPGGPAPAVVEDLLGGKASRDHRGARVAGGRRRPRPATCRRSSTGSSSWRGRAPARGRRGPLGGPARRGPARAARRGARRRATGKPGRGQGRSSTRPCSAGSSPGSATPSSTARSAPARPAPQRLLAP